MINLNDTKTVIKLQGGESVITSISGLDKQLTQAWNETQLVKIPETYRSVKNILVCGMGGSRFPALIVNYLFKDNLALPLAIQDDYTPPAWVDEHTLVILSSYSGTTEEVISSAHAARVQGATKFIGVTTGGDVTIFLKKISAPCYIFDPIHNPSGQPRIGAGYTLGALLGIFYALGFITLDKQEIISGIARLPHLTRQCMIDSETATNPAKQLAQKIYNHYPYYIVAEFLTGVGNAIQNQTNETAKSISSFRVISELNHHLMEGLKFPKAHGEIALFVFFYSKLYTPSIQKRFHITRDVVEQNTIQTLWHELQGATKIEQAFELLALGGYVTMYLSALYDQDPTAIPYVDYFKKKLKE